MEDYLCEGSWDSFIVSEGNNVPNGFFELRIDAQTGEITGTHVVMEGEEEKEYNVWGSCQHPASGSGNGAHHINILEPRGSYAYRYLGVIVPDSGGAEKHKVPRGKRRTLGNAPAKAAQGCEAAGEHAAAGSAAASGEEDWIAEKTT